MDTQDIENFFRIIRAFDKYEYQVDLTDTRLGWQKKNILWEAQTQAQPFYERCLLVTKDLRDFIYNLGYAAGPSCHEMGILPGEACIPTYRLTFSHVLPGNLTIDIQIIPKYSYKTPSGEKIYGYDPVYKVEIERPQLSRWEKIVDPDDDYWPAQKKLETPDRWCKIEIE